MKFKKGQIVELTDRTTWNGERHVFGRAIIEEFWEGVKAYVIWVTENGKIDQNIYRIVVDEKNVRAINDEKEIS